MPTRLALALLPALALLLMLPLAGADHVFSHRVYVVGRVVDSEGLPAPGLSVRVDFEGADIRAPCFDSKPEVTGPRGDYEVCRHAHELAPGVRVVVRVGNASREAPLDPELRHASVSLQLEEPAPSRDLNGQREFARAFRVAGRAFALLPSPQPHERVEVTATPLAGNVTAALLSGNETVAEGQARLDEHGGYALDLDVAQLPPDAIVRVQAGREVAEGTASELFRRADLNLVRDLRLAQGPGQDAPGSKTPLGLWPLAAALVTAAVVAQGRRPR